jgi:signal transduction histidine kinase
MAEDRRRPEGTGQTRGLTVRIAIASTVLFLVVGALVVGLTYLLLADSLPRPTAHGMGRLFPSNGSHSMQGAPSPPPTFPASTTQADTQRQLLAFAQHQRAQTLNHLLLYGGLALAATTLIAFGCSWALARRGLSPLRRIVDTTTRISHENLSERIDLPGRPDELTDLADTIDNLLERLQQSFESQAHFAASASRELRTPLAIERAVLDVALYDPRPTVENLKAAMQTVRQVGIRSERLIDRLLLLAKSSQPIEKRDVVDLHRLAMTALDERKALIRDKRLTIRVAGSPTPVYGDGLLLQQALGNLIDNAIRYNLEGGRLDVATWPCGGTHSVASVANSGPRISPDVVSQLVVPFRRVQPDRTAVKEGTGLGLAIVQAIVTAHGGTLELRSRKGGGIHAQLRIPHHSTDPPAQNAGSTSADSE